MASNNEIIQKTLNCGVQLLAEPMPGYHTATLILQVGGGMASEPADKLGLAYIVEQSLDKGTKNYTARGLADAFDEIGAGSVVHAGRQTWAFLTSALPEFMPRAVDLLGEMVVQPTFPDDAVQTAVSLTAQELVGLEDSPKGLLRRQMALQAYGDILGRHPYGNAATLRNIDAAHARELWQRVLGESPIAVCVAGAFDLDAIEEALEEIFTDAPRKPQAPSDRQHLVGTRVPFSAQYTHVQKELEQTQIGISFPGVRYDDPEYATECVILAVLSGGMSSRLFTEVREKRGLVYWVGAWHEQPLGLGMIHIGAATTPQRCEQTYKTLMAEVSRLSEDLSGEELERAKIGLIADGVTTGASPYRHASELATDFFHTGHAMAAKKKHDAIRQVSLEDIRAYLEAHSRDTLSIVTVGPEPLASR